MDVHAKLAEIRRSIEDARSMPMSASAVVNRAEVLAQLDELSQALDDAFTEARRVTEERSAVVDGGRTEAEQIVKDAHAERERILSDTEVFLVAKREAADLVEKAQAEADGLRKETDDYVDSKLANFEITLERTIEAVRRGRDKLAGRSAFEGITDEAVDEMVLPDHLER